MIRPRIGVDLQDLRRAPKEGIRLAAEMGFSAVELPVADGELAPRNLSGSGRRHLRRIIDGAGLSMAALRADLPGLRLTDPATVDQWIERTRESLDLAADMDVGVVTTAVGALTHPESGEPSALAISALGRIGEMADARGLIVALRSTREAPGRLAAVLDALRCPNLRPGLDPAMMVMAGVDPRSAWELFGSALSMVHFRDATAGSADRPGQEVAFGQGDVDLREMVAALRDAEYAGPLIVRRAESNRPTVDLLAGRELLQGWLSVRHRA